MPTEFNLYRDNSRAALAVLKARRDREILEWEMALKVQAAWRGRLAKMLVLAMRIVRVCFLFLYQYSIPKQLPAATCTVF